MKNSKHSTLRLKTLAVKDNQAARVILAPSEWPTAIRMAKIDTEPYIVKEMTYKSCLDWKRLKVTPDKLVDQGNVRIKWKAIRSVRFVKGCIESNVQPSRLRKDILCLSK